VCHELLIYVDLLSLSLCIIKFYNWFVGQPVELETVKFTVTSASGDKIKVEGDSENVVFKRGLDDTPTAINTMKIPWFNDTIDADGIRNYAVEFNDTGSYAITVTVTEGDPEGDSDTVDITVSEKGVDFNLPSTVAIGEKITIKGTTTSGMYVRKAKLSVPSVALGDDFIVKRISRGADTVNILAVGPKGSGGTAIDSGKISTNYAENIFGKTVPGSSLDRTFEKKIDVDEDADTGSYIIAVLSPGRDGIYNGLPGEVMPNNFAAVFVASYNLVSFAKTQDQIVSMARDATIDAAGSDDLAWGGYIMVQSPSLLLDTVSDVPLGAC
jgi:hypothetical protein